MDSKDTAATIRIYAAAWARGDIATIFSLYHPEFTLHYPGANRLSGVHRGKEAALAAMREFGIATQRKLAEIVAAMAGEGYASIIANNALKYDEELIHSQLERAYRGAILAAQEETT